jgi:hypothetical protein
VFSIFSNCCFSFKTGIFAEEFFKANTQSRMNLEISRRTVRNLGCDISRNTSIILLPSISVPSVISYLWSLGTTNDEMMSDFLEG